MPAGDARPGLIGRDAELATLVAVIGGPPGSVALIAGDAGMGKSRLVAEALELTEVAHLVGRTTPASSGRAFELVLSMVEPTVRHWTDLPGSLAGVAPTLRRVLTPVAPGLPPGRLDGPDHADSVGDQVRALVALFRHLGRTLLVVDDLHWADVESLHALDRLLALPDPPTVVGTYRPGAAVDGTALGQFINAVDRRRDSWHVHLEPFSTEEVRAFVREVTRDDPDQRSLDRLIDQTGGNPFLLDQLISAGGPAAHLTGSAEMPWTLVSSLRRELDALAEVDADVLAMAAVLGTEFDFDLLQRATGITERELIGHLRELRDRHLIVETDLDRFRFRHDLLREAMLDGLLGRELRRHHDAAFEAVSASAPTDFAELARHARGAHRVDDLVALAPHGVRHYLAAGSTRRAHELAAAALAARPDHVELLELAVRAAWLSGSLDEARRVAERWRAALRAVGSEGRTYDLDAITLLARIAYESGDVEARAAYLDELADWLTRAPDDLERAQIDAVLAQHAMLDRRLDDAVEHAGRAIVVATAIGADDIARRASVERSTARLLLGDVAASVDELERIAEEAERHGDDHTAARAWYNSHSAGDVESDERRLRRMRAAAARVGADQMSTSGYVQRRIDLAMRRGDLAEARALAAQVRLLDATSGLARRVAWADAAHAAEAGDVDSCRQLVSGLDAAGKPPVAHIPRLAPLLPMRPSLADGEADAALDRLGEVVAGAVAAAVAPAIVLGIRELVDAGVDVERVRAVVDASDERPNAALVEAGRAITAAYAHDPDAGEWVAGLAPRPFHWDPHAVFHEACTPLLQAELHIAAARWFLRTGDSARADEHACAAASILNDWPGPRRDEAMRLRAVAADSELDDTPLTGREIDVARLLARGMTNGEIADELYIARKTVSTHVSNILTKLHMRSRTEIAAWAVSTGLVA